ncbi:uncharacterized protein LOC126779908 [Nymphalis io]|uniref:uncharacterized protein LOC126779908 n=1 Tax=Inachis io TaxID=171585 RepID=UPI0021696BE0|nr:uncharacterized protein LOC126779908 [Nymphalis io]
MAVYMTSFFLFYFFNYYVKGDQDIFKKEHFVFWPNGTIPFYINPDHFDNEQTNLIMTTLSSFGFKTCLEFHPILGEPQPNLHIMVFENPRGIRKCIIGMEGHAKEEPHRIVLGYDCLRSPQIDMLLMKALGFPFEHNRASRDVFIDVQFENIEPGSIPFFTKEKKLPPELRVLPYDINSVMHFGEREYSKNGHRTIIFKNLNAKQNRIGLTKNDLRKIEIIYGPECQKRDRQAKIDVCKSYPSSRKKRETEVEIVKSLRVNPNITPPPDNKLIDDLTNSVKELGIENEAQDLLEQVHRITAKALENARIKRCNTTEINNETYSISHDVSNILEATVNYIKAVVSKALQNSTAFCDKTNDIDIFLRAGCSFGTGNRCPVFYKPTKSGSVRYSTQHRPVIRQSTKHDGKGNKSPYVKWLRASNETDDRARKKRDLTDVSNLDMETVTDHDLTAGANVSEVLTYDTTVSVQKVLNFAPVRRFQERDSRMFGSKEKQQEEENSNTSSESTKKKANSKRVTKKALNIELLSDKHKKRKEQYKENDSQSDSETEEERPKIKKSKKTKEPKISVELPKTVKLSRANREFYDERMWPDKIVRYVIRDDPRYNLKKVRERLEEVNSILKIKTCVQLQEISEREGRKYRDYLVLDTIPDYVTGRVGGEQNFGCLELFEGGQHRQHAAMMVMAMLGFYFEVSRHDRDKYIRVHNRHIRADKLHHFEKIRSDATLALAYDYNSATHPAWQFWRRVGKRGISSVATYKDQDPDGSVMRSLGQNEELLSETDIIKINSVYGVQCFKRRNENN